MDGRGNPDSRTRVSDIECFGETSFGQCGLDDFFAVRALASLAKVLPWHADAASESRTPLAPIVQGIPCYTLATIRHKAKQVVNRRKSEFVPSPLVGGKRHETQSMGHTLVHTPRNRFPDRR